MEDEAVSRKSLLEEPRPGPTVPGMTTATRPSYLRSASMGLVLVGAVFGVAGREGLVLTVPEVEGVPVVISLVNVVGAFLLGFLYEGLARRKPGAKVTAELKLLLGTGFCGGFTTYSSLATDTALLMDRDRFDIAAVYVLGTVIVGAAATLAGIALGDRLRGPRTEAGA